MKKFLWLTAVVVTFTFYYSCTKDKTQKPVASTCSGVDSATNTYTLRIKAIMDNNCALGGCHDAGSASNGVVLDSYAATKTAFQNKPVLCTVNWGSGCLQMPEFTPKLADSLITYMQCWSDNGYPQ